MNCIYIVGRYDTKGNGKPAPAGWPTKMQVGRVPQFDAFVPRFKGRRAALERERAAGLRAPTATSKASVKGGLAAGGRVHGVGQRRTSKAKARVRGGWARGRAAPSAGLRRLSRQLAPQPGWRGNLSSGRLFNGAEEAVDWIEDRADELHAW